MAVDLGVDRRTIARWIAGDMIPAPGVWRELAGLLADRAAECSDAAAAITRDPPQQMRPGADRRRARAADRETR